MLEKIQQLIKKCQGWCPWAIVITGFVLLLLGLALDAVTLKALWFVITLLILAAGGYCLYIIHKDKLIKPKQK